MQVKGTFQWLNFLQPEATSTSLIQSQQNTKRLSVAIHFKDMLGEEKLTTGGEIDARFISATEWQRARLHAPPHLCMCISYWLMWTWEGGRKKHFDSHSALFCNTLGPNSGRLSYEPFSFLFIVCVCVSSYWLFYCDIAPGRVTNQNRDTPDFD